MKWALLATLFALLVLAEITRADPFVQMTSCGSGPLAGQWRLVHLSKIEAVAPHDDRDDCVRVFMEDGRTIYIQTTLDEIRLRLKEHEH